MSPQIMRLPMDPDHLSCFIHNFSPGRIGYREYSLIRPNPFPGYVFLEAVRNLLRDKDNFLFFSTFGGSECELSILDVNGCQFQHFTDPHSAPGHQLKNQPVSGFDRAKDDFIHHFLFEDSPAHGSRGSIELFEHGGIAWASEIGFEVLSDEVEERGQLGVPGPFGCLFGVLIDLSEERENFLWGQGDEVSFTKLGGQFGKDRLVGFDGVFFE